MVLWPWHCCWAHDASWHNSACGWDIRCWHILLNMGSHPQAYQLWRPAGFQLQYQMLAKIITLKCKYCCFLHCPHWKLFWQFPLQLATKYHPNDISVFISVRMMVKSRSISVLHKVFLAPVLRTSGSWNLPVGMEGSLVWNFNNYYVLLIHVFDGCINRFDPYDHFNLVCCCLSPVFISDKRSCWKISQSLKSTWLDVEMLVPLSKKKSISAVEMPVKFQSDWKTRRGLAKNCDRTFYVILNQPQDLFSVQQAQVW